MTIRPARIIALVNQKGGPGKTTVAMHLAGELARRGARVMVADADPQGTATRWAAAAPEDLPFPAAVAGLAATDDRLHRELQEFLAAFDYIVVDCPPSADSPISRGALLVADLALVPVIPSPPDLWAGVAIGQVIANVTAINETLQARLLVNQRKPHTRLAASLTEVLPRYGITVLDTQIGDREAFRHAAAGGITASDVPRAGAAAAEIERLTDEVLAVLDGRSDRWPRRIRIPSAGSPAPWRPRRPPCKSASTTRSGSPPGARPPEIDPLADRARCAIRFQVLPPFWWVAGHAGRLSG
jgi:chromosome partitioning protein